MAVALTVVRAVLIPFFLSLTREFISWEKIIDNTEGYKVRKQNSLTHLPPVLLSIGNLCFWADLKIYTGDTGSHMSLWLKSCSKRKNRRSRFVQRETLDGNRAINAHLSLLIVEERNSFK